MIYLPPADLGQEEAIFWVLTHLKDFQENSDNLFKRITSRIDAVNSSCEELQSRLEVVNRKVKSLQQANTAGVLTCLSTFPDSKYVPSADLLVPINTSKRKSVFKPNVRSTTVVDMRRELEDRKRFYLPNQLDHHSSARIQENPMPRKVATFADMFFCGTDELTSGKKIKSSKRERRNNGTIATSSSAPEDVVDTSVISGDLHRVADPLEYIPEAGPIEDLDLPNILPDLPGIADDLVLPDFDDILPSIIPDIPQITTEPNSSKEAETFSSQASSSTLTSKFDENEAKGTKVEDVKMSTESKVDAPPAAPKEVPLASTVASAPVLAPPPPPPPPPPPSLLSPAPAPAQPALVAQDNDRADLMAAIRAAGGAGKAKLKSVASQRRSVKESESLSSSALSEKSSSGGNTLMMSLAKALEARRKAISGMNPNRASADPESSKGIDDGKKSDIDDDWK